MSSLSISVRPEGCCADAYLCHEHWTLGKGCQSDLAPLNGSTLYILAALQTGARRGELASLRWSDIDMKARTIAFAKTKNGERRVVPLTDTLREALQALPRPLDPQAEVFPALSADAVTIAFRRLTRDLGIPNLRFHDLRHDVASTLTMAGVPQRTVMEILGHKDPRMTLRYQHLTPAHLREAMTALDSKKQEAPAQPQASRQAG
jgi:integrase